MSAVRILSVVATAAAVALSSVSADVEAKRLGGGGSFGRQSVSPSGGGLQRSATPSAPAGAPHQGGASGAAPAAPAVPGAPVQPGAPRAPMGAPAAAGAAAAAASSPWKRMLGAAAVGLGIAALASWLGVSSELAGMLGIVLVGLLIAMAVAMFLRRRQGPATAGAAAGGTHAARAPWLGPEASPPGYATRDALGPQAGHDTSAPVDVLRPTASTASPAAERVPAGFDVHGFVDNAKGQFLRLQAAFDRGDLAALREVASSDVFDELRRQIDERRGAPNVTEVVTLEAELLEVRTEDDEHTASIRFHGLIREAAEAAAGAFDEIWHLAKPRSGGSGWLLVGIQSLD